MIYIQLINDDGDRLLINIKNIVTVAEDEKKIIITTITGDVYELSCTYDNIKSIIDNAGDLGKQDITEIHYN